MKYYPVYLDIRGRTCLVVGGGDVAARKVGLLQRSGAAVTALEIQKNRKIIHTAPMPRCDECFF